MGSPCPERKSVLVFHQDKGAASHPALRFDVTAVSSTGQFMDGSFDFQQVINNSFGTAASSCPLGTIHPAYSFQDPGVTLQSNTALASSSPRKEPLVNVKCCSTELFQPYLNTAGRHIQYQRSLRVKEQSIPFFILIGWWDLFTNRLNNQNLTSTNALAKCIMV